MIHVTPPTTVAQLDTTETQPVALIRAGHLSSGDSAPTPTASDWQPLLRAAERHKLMPLLHRALKSLGRSDELPDEVNEQLTAAYMHSYFANARSYEALAAIQQDCAHEQIPLVLLKGVAMALTLYDDIALRPFGDLDLLVRGEHVERVVHYLTTHGYSPELEPCEGFHRQFSHEQPFMRVGTQPSFVDLHWQLFGITYYRERCGLEWFWRRTVDITQNGLTYALFGADAQLLHLCAHLKLHHRHTQLLWTYDIALLLARCGDQIHWPVAIAAAQRCKLIPVVRSACDDVRAQWGVPIPPAVAAELQSISVSVEERTVFRIATMSDTRLVPVLDAWYRRGLRMKLPYWFHKAFPCVAYMQAAYGLRSRLWLPLYYARRLIVLPVGMVRAALTLLPRSRRPRSAIDF